VLFLALCICDGGSFYIASKTLVELDDHCAIMLKFLIEELQLVVENFSMLDHILLHLLWSFLHYWHIVDLMWWFMPFILEFFLWFSLFLLNMFLNGVCEEFGDILVLYILTLSWIAWKFIIHISMLSLLVVSLVLECSKCLLAPYWGPDCW